MYILSISVLQEAVMVTKVQKWGNSIGLRIPKAIAQEAEIEEGASVDLVVESGRLIVRPVRKKYTLEELVSKITPENRHPETDWGPPVGKEVW
jgi:antitoxin MazE